jgi:hypothetical protein
MGLQDGNIAASVQSIRVVGLNSDAKQHVGDFVGGDRLAEKIALDFIAVMRAEK